MAERTTRCTGIILHARDTARGDRLVTVLTQEGIQTLFMFGGARSSLRSAASPFMLADLEIYADARSEFRKLTGVTILETYDSLRQSIEHLQAASMAAEFILKTSAFGGEYATALSMLTDLLHELCSCDAGRAIGLGLAFLWKALIPLGLLPDTDACESCGKPLMHTTGTAAWYARGDAGFLCPACAQHRLDTGFPRQAMLVLSGQDLSVLEALAHAPRISAAESAHAASSAAASRVIAALAERAAEGKLASLHLFSL
ncbi:MAG: DNA repair protein RecO [Spirochaetaceae bacterium]|nr:DNA repair protein RecO [Spirochaetaceae bacterium]